MKSFLYSIMAAVMAIGLYGCALSIGGTDQAESTSTPKRAVQTVYENGECSHCALYDEKGRHVGNIYPSLGVPSGKESNPCEHFHWR